MCDEGVARGVHIEAFLYFVADREMRGEMRYGEEDSCHC